MAKRRRSSKRSSKCPEPLNTLIDIAAGLTMGAVASHMEKKYNYSKKGKINPYAVSAAKMAAGRMNSTEDILRTGAFLGAMGSFNVEADDVPSCKPYVPEDPVFSQIRETKVNDNRYAWRLNCEDGSAYGISPYDYETRAAYHQALVNARKDNTVTTEAPAPEVKETAPTSQMQHQFVRVSRLDNGANQYYLADGIMVKVGDEVTVPTETGTAQGIVLAVETHSATTAPVPPETTLGIKKMAAT